MRTVLITLGDKQFTVTELPRKANIAWRRKLEAELESLFVLIDNTKDANLRDVEQVTGVITQAKQIVMQSPDAVFDLLVGYMKLSKADRSWVENNAYESEVMDAFVAVLTKLAFPFGSIGQLVRTLTEDGTNAPKQTNLKSVSQNGASGPKSLTSQPETS